MNYLNYTDGANKLRPRFKYRFRPMNDNQDGCQNCRRLSVWTCGHSNLVCFQISHLDYFYQMLAQVRTWVLSHNQDGRQNGHHLSVDPCGHSNLVICHPIFFQISEELLLSKSRPNVKMDFVRLNDNHDGCQNGSLWPVCTCALLFSYLSPNFSKFHIRITFIKLFPKIHCFVCLFDLILYVHSTIFQLCGTGLPGLNQY